MTTWDLVQICYRESADCVRNLIHSYSLLVTKCSKINKILTNEKKKTIRYKSTTTQWIKRYTFEFFFYATDNHMSKIEIDKKRPITRKTFYSYCFCAHVQRNSILPKFPVLQCVMIRDLAFRDVLLMLTITDDWLRKRCSLWDHWFASRVSEEG